MRRWVMAAALMVAGACAPQQTTVTVPAEPAIPIPPDYRGLPGWAADDHRAALGAFRQSCQWFDRQADDWPLTYPIGTGRVADWRAACSAALRLADPGRDTARQFFEHWFTPVAVTDGERELGLFTGYYAPILHGSFTQSDRFHVPLHRDPPRRSGRLPSREEIVNGALDGQDLELLWVDDPVDAFFLQIQGSGHVQLDDGRVVGVGYDGQNGHRYFAIGRELIEREVATPETISMQLIRDWLADNPDEADDLMNMNPSYIFFRLRDGGDVQGYLEVPLTPGRSLAIDLDHIAPGIPLWLDINDDPTVPGGELRRLVMAQDTGGAIRGVIAGDLFWGYGDAAGDAAGEMRARGRYFALIPRNATITVATAPESQD